MTAQDAFGATGGRDDASTGSATGGREGPSIGAILLAGGRATRMGGVAKPLLEVGGRSMLDRAITACVDIGCRSITVAGPPSEPPDPRVRWVREDPPFGGPAAAVVAALATATDETEWTFVLACDLPWVDDAVTQLAHDLLLVPGDTDGICLADASSRPQWLTAGYRTGALRRAASALADGGRDASMRALLADLAIAVVQAATDVSDVDTWEDLERARADAAGESGDRR